MVVSRLGRVCHVSQFVARFHVTHPVWSHVWEFWIFPCTYSAGLITIFDVCTHCLSSSVPSRTSEPLTLFQCLSESCRCHRKSMWCCSSYGESSDVVIGFAVQRWGQPGSHDGGFSLISEGPPSGAMTDGAKRRDDTSPIEITTKKFGLSTGAAPVSSHGLTPAMMAGYTAMMPIADPKPLEADGVQLSLPPKVPDLATWGRTIITWGSRSPKGFLLLSCLRVRMKGPVPTKPGARVV